MMGRAIFRYGTSRVTVTFRSLVITHLQRSSLSEVFYSGELLLCVSGTLRPSTEYHYHHTDVL